MNQWYIIWESGGQKHASQKILENSATIGKQVSHFFSSINLVVGEKLTSGGKGGASLPL